jgi:fumarylacetoacetase
MTLNATHDPRRRSWVASANAAGNDFPIQNLPFGVFRHAGDAPRGGVAIGDQIFDLAAGTVAGLFSGEALKAAQAASENTLNSLLALGNKPVSALRARLSDLLREDSPDRAQIEGQAKSLLIARKDVALLLPVAVRQFTDFATSTYHIGRFDGYAGQGNPKCPPVFRNLPVAYNGRASSVAVDGTPFIRPNGQWKLKSEDSEPHYGAEPYQDYELEFGAWFGGQSSTLGKPLALDDAASHLFGYCLLNDWSSRGIQFWESMLGPFLAKSPLTTVSPWIVTEEAMAPFRAPAFARHPEDPKLLGYLRSDADQKEGHLDVELEAFIVTPKMREHGAAPFRICASNFKYLYWTFGQMFTHHMSNGCNLGAGDLIGSGTCSGPSDEMMACLAEKSALGTKPWPLPNGETRTYFEDGDDVILRGCAKREGYVSIGFGNCSGRIHPVPEKR